MEHISIKTQFPLPDFSNCNYYLDSISGVKTNRFNKKIGLPLLSAVTAKNFETIFTAFGKRNNNEWRPSYGTI